MVLCMLFFNSLRIKTNIQLLKLTEKHQTLQSHVEFRSIFFFFFGVCVPVVIISIMQYLLYEIFSYLLLGF